MNKFPILIVLVFLYSSSCDKRSDECKNGHNSLVHQNNSDKRIYDHYYWNFPDTAIGEYNPVNGLTGGIFPGGTDQRSIGRFSCLEEYFANGKKQWVYFFDADSIEAIPWEVVRSTGRGLLMRKELSLEYLKNNNFIINYP